MILYPWYIHCMYNDNEVYSLYKLTNPTYTQNMSDSDEIYQVQLEEKDK